MSNSSSTNDSSVCPYWDPSTQRNFIQPVYTILCPTCFLFGLFGHFLWLAAYIKHRSDERGFSYQILVQTARIFEIFAYATFILFFYHAAGVDWNAERIGGGVAWVKDNYAIMWFTAHVVPMLADAAYGINVFTSVAMTADRMFALWKPVAYRNSNHCRTFLIACITTFLIPMADSSVLSFAFDVISRNGTYNIQHSSFGLSTSFPQIYYLNCLVRSAAVLMLIICGVSSCCLFARKTKKVVSMVANEARKEAQRRAVEKALFMLTLYQSIVALILETLVSSFTLSFIINPQLYMCADIFFAITDAIYMMLNAMEFYVILASNATFRKMVVATLRKPKANATVAPAVNNVQVEPGGEGYCVLKVAV